MKRPSSQQIVSVLSLPARERYSHFVKHVADWEEAWGLYADGWALAGTERGEKVFPLWPAKEYAVLCATGDWSGYSPRSIPLEDLLEALLPRLRSDGALAGVFYTPDNKGVTVPPDQLLQDLRIEASRYE